MEQSKDLEIVAATDVEVGLSRSQPWKRDPMNPIDLSWFHKDVEQFQSGLGIDEGQSGSSKLSNIKVALVKEGPESESTAVVSGDERLEAEAMSSPVIKVCGSTRVEASAWEASVLETTEMGDRNSPYGA